MTSDADRRLLLEIAREAIAAHVHRRPMPDVAPAALHERCAGVFVTLHRAGELRGCIGHLETDAALPRVVVQCAIGACSADTRFPPVSLVEVEQLHIEISLLGPLETITASQEIEVGRHGLVVEQGRRRGLLLPQVAAERRWDPDTFLSQTCRKAGLPPDAWKRGASIWRFGAEVFGE